MFFLWNQDWTQIDCAVCALQVSPTRENYTKRIERGNIKKKCAAAKPWLATALSGQITSKICIWGHCPHAKSCAWCDHARRRAFCRCQDLRLCPTNRRQTQWRTWVPACICKQTHSCQTQLEPYHLTPQRWPTQELRLGRISNHRSKVQNSCCREEFAKSETGSSKAWYYRNCIILLSAKLQNATISLSAMPINRRCGLLFGKVSPPFRLSFIGCPLKRENGRHEMWPNVFFKPLRALEYGEFYWFSWIRSPYTTAVR